MARREAAGAVDPERWWESRAYRAAAALFDRGNWLEAHEALEALWLGLPRRSPDATLLQGLIQSAVALHKLGEGQVAPARRLAARGAARLRRAGRRMGIDGVAVARALEARIQDAEAPAPRLAVAWPDAEA